LVAAPAPLIAGWQPERRRHGQRCLVGAPAPLIAGWRPERRRH